MATPQCQLRSGDIVSAKKNLSDLQIRISGDDVREEIDYYLAMIDLFSGKFDSAQVRLRKLMVDYPRGFFVNDAPRGETGQQSSTHKTGRRSCHR